MVFDSWGTFLFSKFGSGYFSWVPLFQVAFRSDENFQTDGGDMSACFGRFCGRNLFNDRQTNPATLGATANGKTLSGGPAADAVFAPRFGKPAF
jgi:hypothetical protein